MTTTLPTLAPTTPLAKLFNEYIAGLQPVADMVAPRLSLRSNGFLIEPHSCAQMFWYAHTTAAALVALYDNYAAARAALHATVGAGPEAMNVAGAPFFATPETTDERIGAAPPDCLHPSAELAVFARARAKAAGLVRFGTPALKVVAPEVEARVRRVLLDGQAVAEAFLSAESAIDFENVQHLLRLIIEQGKRPAKKTPNIAVL